MKHDNKNQLDESLKQLDDDIIWSRERQQRTRRKMLTKLENEKLQRVFNWKIWLRKRALPILASLLLFGVLTTVVLSELSGRDATTQESDANSESSMMNGDNGDEDAHVILKDEDEDKDKDKDKDKDENNKKAPPQDSEANENKQVEKDPEKSESDDADQDETGEKILTQAEVIQAVKEEMNTDLPLKLPSELPLDKGQHLTAVTKSEANRYQVIFYQSDQPIPINNEKLVNDKNAADVVARVQVEKYGTQKEADEAISFEDFSEQGGEETELGYDITGYQDAGAGSMWTSWNEGRWALAAHAHTNESDEGIELAKEAIAFLEENVLPIPNQYGFAHLDVNQQDNRILWEKETTVYTIDQVKDPMDGLEIAVNFE